MEQQGNEKAQQGPDGSAKNRNSHVADRNAEAWQRTAGAQLGQSSRGIATVRKATEKQDAATA